MTLYESVMKSSRLVKEFNNLKTSNKNYFTRYNQRHLAQSIFKQQQLFKK